MTETDQPDRRPSEDGEAAFMAVDLIGTVRQPHLRGARGDSHPETLWRLDTGMHLKLVQFIGLAVCLSLASCALHSDTYTMRVQVDTEANRRTPVLVDSPARKSGVTTHVPRSSGITVASDDGTATASTC